ncbi:MAG: YhdP family protein, partial [Sulfuricella sp.]
LERGSGGVRAWLAIGNKQVRGITADVRLDDVLTRLKPELPQLDLQNVSGRVSWRDLNPGLELQASKLSFAIRDALTFGPTSARFKSVPERVKKPALGDLQVDGLAFAPLLELAAYLPLDSDVREKLRLLQPKGVLRELAVSWSGTWETPIHYAVKGKFADLAVQPYVLSPGNTLPGFSGLSGNVDANEKGGSAGVNAHRMKLDLPGVFDHALELDTLTAQVGWSSKAGQHEFKLASASFANSHLAGTAFGTYGTAANGPGRIDLSGQLTRADARFVSAYMPLVVGKETRDWLEKSIKAGQSGDVRLRLKGDLAKFPFVDGKSGLFEVAVKGNGGVLEYAPGWPAIEGISVDLLFRGKSMDIYARAGHTFGMQMQKVHVQIADLMHMDELLTVDGEARGPTADMLKFVAQSPVNGMIDGFTEGMQATGNGLFRLSLKIPLRRLDDMTVAGSYAFQNNNVQLGAGAPMLEQVNGALQFTGSSVIIPRITAQFLGGPATLVAATQQGVVQVNASGKATAAGLNKAFPHPLLRRLQGSTKWNGQITLRKKLADAVFSSNLQGLGSELPLPFNKKAADSVALRLERRAASLDQDTISVSYGKVLAAQLVRRREGNEMKVERGAINLGGGPLNLPASGLWLTGTLPYLDLDFWRNVSSPAGGASAGAEVAVDGVNFNLTTVDVFGKRFNDLRLNAVARNGSWQAALESREMSGNVNWTRSGAGRVIGRFKSLTVPSSAPPKLSEPSVSATPAANGTNSELPALDIVAENFSMRNMQLGHLELLAAPNMRDWRIEKLKLTTPESVLSMDGVWQDWLQQPRSRVNLQLETSDVGKLLARVGHPDSVKGGTAKLKGQFYWVGSPTEFNYATLSGLMSLEAHKGQFSKLEPGIGKLLGVLSLQSLPRRITLDFRDVFSDGFAFDDISGSVKVNQGVVSGNDFKMDGPAAKVTMSGEADLARETQNLRVRVVPLFGDTLSGAATLLGGPVVGLTALLVQKMLKDPVGQINAFEYSITGTWDNPVVTKLKKKVEESKTWDGN